MGVADMDFCRCGSQTDKNGFEGLPDSKISLLQNHGGLGGLGGLALILWIQAPDPQKIQFNILCGQSVFTMSYSQLPGALQTLVDGFSGVKYKAGGFYFTSWRQLMEMVRTIKSKYYGGNPDVGHHQCTVFQSFQSTKKVG